MFVMWQGEINGIHFGLFMDTLQQKFQLSHPMSDVLPPPSDDHNIDGFVQDCSNSIAKAHRYGPNLPANGFVEYWCHHLLKIYILLGTWAEHVRASKITWLILDKH